MKKIFVLIFALIISCFSMVALSSCTSEDSGQGSSIQSEHSSRDEIDDSQDETVNSSDEEERVEEFTISFNSAGGTEITAQRVKKGECATLPIEPTKTIIVLDNGATIEYEFVGWYRGENEYDFSLAVNENFTLVAKWNEVRLSPPLNGRN